MLYFSEQIVEQNILVGWLLFSNIFIRKTNQNNVYCSGLLKTVSFDFFSLLIIFPPFFRLVLENNLSHMCQNLLNFLSTFLRIFGI